MTPRTVTILGATGSIGISTADVIAAQDGHYQVEAVTARRDVAGLAATARRLGAKQAVLADEAGLADLRAALADTDIACHGGTNALCEAASVPVDIVMAAIVGAAGVLPTAAAIAAGNDVALANKECLTCAGAPFMAQVKQKNVRILPVDSEHNALFRLLENKMSQDIEKYTITASGGPFLSFEAARLDSVTPSQALAHPVWSMGRKISVDSATLMNKGLELIEAHHLFDIAPDRLEVLIHPTSLVHAMVTYTDGSIHAEMGAPDMRRPIAHCLAWPNGSTMAHPALDLAAVGALEFFAPDHDRFPALGVAQSALASAKGAPTVVNAANEIAVEAFLTGKIAFTGIATVATRTWREAEQCGLMGNPGTIDDALLLDQAARQIAKNGLKLWHNAPM